MAQARFPIGELDKDTVRAHARRLGLRVADKPDSQEICFVPDGDYAAFVEREAAGAGAAGVIVAEDGRVLGTHAGVHRFTIGQRKGLRLSSSEPLYVLDIDAAAARVTVGAATLWGAPSLTASQRQLDVGAARRPDGDESHRSDPPSPPGRPGRVRALEARRAELKFDAAADGRHAGTGGGVLRGRRGAGRRVDRLKRVH